MPIEIAGFKIPRQLQEVASRIQQSHRILELPDDWDGEGSPGYAEATWKRAIGLIVTAAISFHDQQRMVPAPIITKGDEGSIDIQWRTLDRNVLINVPPKKVESITFYAHDRNNEDRNIAGTLDASADNSWLLGWLDS